MNHRTCFGDVLVLLFIEKSICTICAYSDFFWSVICMIQVSKLSLLFESILNLWPVLILEIFSFWDIKKSQFQFLVTLLAVFFWSINCTILVCRLYLLFQTILNLWPMLILEISSGWDIIKNGQSQFLVTFLAFFFWSVNCTNLVCIFSYFEHG